jgi:hypothetical protein
MFGFGKKNTEFDETDRFDTYNNITHVIAKWKAEGGNFDQGELQELHDFNNMTEEELSEFIDNL